ncbi:MAG: HAMP domain-containing histidine kinase [Hamadaea sp.]|uniref:sensor histidine kinase n=1 Tax=Hamadaea sp. TaxID=2024425 RepID=UPI0017F4FBE8|nr:HAMP domain-containing sensor histidine kinase [Hamadaea sp.]NUR70832.1 HAMP domain-containing histidine kinase [Hamadaea sp.]NUT19938.1 HAMP domain-containing histidine kinase [Hamadaea sp.]
MAARAIPPGRLRRRLTVAFVLVAGISAGALAAGSYLLVREARLDDSLQQTASDVRPQLTAARQFLPLDGERRDNLLAAYESSGRHVILVADGETTASNPAYAPPLSAELRAEVAAGQIAFDRPDKSRMLVIGGRIPGSEAQLYVVRPESRIHSDLDQLRTVLLAGWLAVVVLAALIGRLLARRTLDPAIAWERRFTADVSHELRTPVTSLVAAASLLAEQVDRLPDGVRRPAELLIGDVVRLRRLVEELMEISRLDAGREPVIAATVDPLALLRALTAAHDWPVTVEGDAVDLFTDPRRLERVLVNLVANAVEHGAEPIRATVRTEARTVTITVSDAGPGIAPEQLPHVFDRFYKADPARSGQGSGLGLAIARENARLLGGRVTIVSEPGDGTHARLELPVTQRLPRGERAAAESEERALS